MAFNDVISQYDVDVVNQPNVWPEIAKKMADRVQAEMRSVIGITKDLDVFCSTTVITTGKCLPIEVRIEKIDAPAAADILNQRRDREINTQNALDAVENQKKIEAAQQELERQKADADAGLYNTPGYAEERRWQLLIEAIKACNGNAQCIIQLSPTGGTSNVQLQVPTK